MTERRLTDFDIDQIARSGQCFRFRPLGEQYYALVAGSRYVEIRQQGQIVRFDCPEEEFEAVWRPYFDLEADYSRYKSAVAKRDKYLQSAVAAGGGLGLLRQDLWGNNGGFIILQQNNNARISKMVGKLCFLFGENCYNRSKQV